MNINAANSNGKVNPGHLKKTAYLYIRQSTLRQVFENTESTQRQYGLRQRAIVLGWQSEQIEVIDCDQGQSGASTGEREGFQRLVAEVGLGKAGIVMGLEVSRLARNCADWHRLLEICALSGTLILDEDGLYDPAHFNDRLLLGLKGTMSEAELHVLRTRLRGGVLSKAQRGELKMPLPVGLAYDPAQRVVLDPDKQVQSTLRYFFETFRRTGAAWATVQAFGEEGLKFPRRGPAGYGALVWQTLRHTTALATLHNPRYAGAFCFGRSRSWKDGQGRWRFANLPRDQWQILIKDLHPGYISWAEYEENQKRLQHNRQARAIERQRGPAREGPALLQGLVICGKCGRAMSLRYHLRGGRLSPDYICQKQYIERCRPVCQNVPGSVVDEALSALILQSVSPLALEVALNVQEQLQKRLAESDRLRRQYLERAQYEAEQARIRYMCVDPTNRFVADTLEALWNDRLRQLEQARQDYEKQREGDQQMVTQQQKTQILALAEDFPRLWKDPATSDRDRKRMARLILEDVTLNRDHTLIIAKVRFKGGTTKILSLSTPPRIWELRKTKPEIIAEIDRLLEQCTDSEIAAKLNEKGWRSSTNQSFSPWTILRLRRSYKLPPRAERLRAKGLLSAKEIAPLIGSKPHLVDYWREQGLLKGSRVNDKNEYLYKPPGMAAIQQIKQRTRLKDS
ncbi:MAG: recombinase family protein [Verrucomicrobia bacterium]|nr:recombinase family protein [Verrucomicrobiota bacterium]